MREGGERLLAGLIQQNGQHLDMYGRQISSPGQQQDLTGRPVLLAQKSISIDGPAILDDFTVVR